MSNWLFEGIEVSSVDSLPAEAVGFIYKITDVTTGKFYIGRKSLYSTTTKALTKTELAELTDKRKSKKKKVTKESDWMKYWGSNKDLINEVKQRGSTNFSREILQICFTKKQLTYYELYHQCTHDVLRKDTWNQNILGKFFPKDL